MVIEGRTLGVGRDRWIDGFLGANRALFERLDVRARIDVEREARVLLHPGAKIGAIPLRHPVTQKVAAGLLIEPRYDWSSLGAVFSEIGFSVEPALGGAPMVPGSAREVPPWVLAGPVLKRITALLADLRRGFVPREETRRSPRGRVIWKDWAVRNLPRGSWTRFPCAFSEPENDPALLAGIRFTLARLADDLSRVAWSPPARCLLDRLAGLEAEIGPGAVAPLPPRAFPFDTSATLIEGLQAMSWVAERRGLGGARILDGLAWDLPIADVWEAFVSRFASHLGRLLGLVPTPFGGTAHRIRWSGPVDSMAFLIPDVELRGEGRVVLIDAKYKRHLDLLRRSGWRGLREDLRAAHRADLHQALAYAAIQDADRVDTVLAYPHRGTDTATETIADLTSGRRRVRLVLASIPFAFCGPVHREANLERWRALLAA